LVSTSATCQARLVHYPLYGFGILTSRSCIAVGRQPRADLPRVGFNAKAAAREATERQRVLRGDIEPVDVWGTHEPLRDRDGRVCPRVLRVRRLDGGGGELPERGVARRLRVREQLRRRRYARPARRPAPARCRGRAPRLGLEQCQRSPHLPRPRSAVRLRATRNPCDCWGHRSGIRRKRPEQ
jgi:hypothetical protein